MAAKTGGKPVREPKATGGMVTLGGDKGATKGKMTNPKQSYTELLFSRPGATGEPTLASKPRKRKK